MLFLKKSLENDPYSLDRRDMIPGLDRFLEFSSLINDVVVL